MHVQVMVRGQARMSLLRSHSPWFLKTGSLTELWDSLIQLGWKASESWGPTYCHLPSAGVVRVLFMWVLGSNLSPPSLVQELY